MITKDVLLECKFTHRLYGEFSSSKNKSLDAKVTHLPQEIIYVVKNNKKVILETPDLDQAILKYNQAS